MSIAYETLEFSLEEMLLPHLEEINTEGYYRYIGSLTTPPCTENVIWNVFKYKIPISSSQVRTIVLF